MRRPMRSLNCMPYPMSKLICDHQTIALCAYACTPYHLGLRRLGRAHGVRSLANSKGGALVLDRVEILQCFHAADFLNCLPVLLLSRWCPGARERNPSRYGQCGSLLALPRAAEPTLLLV